MLERIAAERGFPEVLNGQRPEFSSLITRTLAAEHGLKQHVIDSGKPTQNGAIESFNARLRDGALDGHWFLTLDEMRNAIETYRVRYNTCCPAARSATSRQQNLLAGIAKKSEPLRQNLQITGVTLHTLPGLIQARVLEAEGR